MTSGGDIDAGRKRRRDFEQNRDVILQAANEAFIEHGVGTSIETVAKRAGVAPATVYRHFPNKDALVDAVFAVRIVAYAEAIEAAQELADPTEAFRHSIHAIVALQTSDSSFRAMMAAREEHPLKDPAVARFGAALLGALQSARESGVIRADVEDADIMLLLLASEGIARPTAKRSPEALRRLVDIALDGACGTREKLHGAPLGFDELLDVTGS